MVPSPSAAGSTRRGVLLAALLTPMAACSLRLEDGAPLPGPKKSAASDATDLETVRRHLVDVMTAAAHESHDVAAAATAQSLHRDHLKRIDATLEGLGRHSLPSVTATQAPTTSSPPAPSSQGPSTSSAPSRSSAKSSSTTSTRAPSPTPWTAAESAWATAPMTTTMARVSATSRPLVLSMAAASLANLTTTGIEPHWPSEASMPSTPAALVTSLDDAIDALQWCAAKTPADQRQDVGAQLTWAYAARAMAQSAATAGRSATRAPVRRYGSTDEARRVARDALAHTLAACVEAGREAATAETVCGVLYVWSGAAGVAQALGSPLRPFPGLAS